MVLPPRRAPPGVRLGVDGRVRCAEFVQVLDTIRGAGITDLVVE